LANKVAEMERRFAQTDEKTFVLNSQLADIQSRLQGLEKKSALPPPVVTPTPVAAPAAPAPAAPAPAAPAPAAPAPAAVVAPPAVPLPVAMSWLEYGAGGVAAILVGLLLWLRRKREEEPPPMEPVATEAAQVTMPEEREAEVSRAVVPPPPEPLVPKTAPPMVEVAEASVVLVPKTAPPMVEMAEASVVLESGEREPFLAAPAAVAGPFSASPFQEEEGESGLSLAFSAQSPVAEMAEGIGEEIALEEGETESIFKDLLAASPAPQRVAVVTPILAEQGGEEPMEMFEFKPVAEAATPPKKEAVAEPQSPKATDEQPGELSLEWEVDDK
ncbi:MAG: hypothetical protein H7835_09175, partial [Magnetococcus sp. XQGC-1]